MKAYFIISQIFYSFTLIPWFAIWGLSFMSFDNGVNVYNVMFVLIISLYPVAVLTSSILAWAFRLKNNRFAIMINLLPMLWVIAFVGLMLV